MSCKVEGCAAEVVALGLCGMHYMRQRRGKPLTYDSRVKPFWSKVDRKGPDECWNWTGFVKSSGHGLTSHKGLLIHASRKAWILTRGRIKDGLFVNHRCDNALCCNPAHMYLGTGADNMIDYWQNTPPELRARRGRKTVLDEQQLERLWKMRNEGATLKECGAEFDVHVATVCRYITIVRKQKLEKNRLSRESASHNPQL